jgi:UrcA family protein
MTKNRIALLGSAMMGAALLFGAGLAKAQDYVRYDDSRYYSYDDRAGETVIVHPDYDRVEKRQLLGRIDGEVNPVELSLSRPVNFSDLNLSSPADAMELRIRIHSTARDLCAELVEREPQLRGDSSGDQECVRTATRNAMRDVFG